MAEGARRRPLCRHRCGAHRGGAALGRLGQGDEPRARGGALHRPGGQRAPEFDRVEPVARRTSARRSTTCRRRPSPRRSISTPTPGCSAISARCSGCSNASRWRWRSGCTCRRAGEGGMAARGAVVIPAAERRGAALPSRAGGARVPRRLAGGLCRGRVRGRPDHAARAALGERHPLRGAAGAVQHPAPYLAAPLVHACRGRSSCTPTAIHPTSSGRCGRGSTG